LLVGRFGDRRNQFLERFHDLFPLFQKRIVKRVAKRSRRALFN
jgi:hypothetical protein